MFILRNVESRLEPPTNSRESGPNGPGFSGLEALVCQGQNLEERERFLRLFIAGNVLEHRLGFPVHGNNYGRPCFSHSADYVRSLGLELAYRLYLVGQLHRTSICSSEI